MKKTICRLLTLLLCAGMLVSVPGVIPCAQAAFIEGKPYNEYTYQEYMNLTSDEKTQFFYGFPSLSAFNQWYNAAKKAADDEKLVIGNNSIDLGQLLKTVATIGETTYTKFADALAAAVSGDTIVLAADVEATSVTVPEGVTLDLCGYKMTVDSFGFVPEEMGKIIDSSEERTGLLNVPVDAAAFLSAEAFAENTLPIYDAANSGYRFFSYTYGQGVALADAKVSGAVKFWYQLQFEAEAYELLYAGDSGVKMGVDVSYTGAEDAIGFIFKKDGSEDVWSKDYAAFVLGYDDYGTAAGNPWLWVRVQNADAVEGLTLTPYVTAGGVDIYLNPIVYN